MGIPSAAADTYTIKFTENCLTNLGLQDLDKTILNSLNHTVLGDQLTILHLAKHSSNTAPSQQPDSLSTNQTPWGYKNPTVSASVKLPPEWSVYTTINGLPTQDCTVHHYSSGNPTVQYSLVTSKPTFLNFVEKEAIDTIESLVTKHSEPMVHCMTCYTIKQDDTESIEDFLILLQAVSPDCEFNCPGCQYDISNIYNCDQFVRGLQNSIFQTDILTKVSQLKTLANIVKHAKSVEAAIQDQSHLENKHPVKTAFTTH